MTRIAIDMDDVIVDTLEAQLAWLRRHDRDGHHPSREELVGKRFDAFASSAGRQALEQVLQAGYIFAELPPMAGALDVFARLYQAHDVFIATAAMDYPRSCAHKIDWLRRHLPFFDHQKLVLCGDKRIVHADFLIDDSPRHFQAFVGTGLLFDAPHNANETRYERLKGWDAVAKKFGV